MPVNLAETLVIKAENLFLLTLRDGSLPTTGPHPLGLWSADCRYLNAHELLLSGSAPLLLQASDALGTRSTQELTNPELTLPGGTVLPARSLSLRCERAVEPTGTLRERIAVHSHHHAQLRLPLELRLGADFEPMLALRGLVPRAERAAPEVRLEVAGVRFSGDGRDGLARSTRVELSTAPADAGVSAGRPGEPPTGTVTLHFELELPPGGSHELALRVATSESGRRPDARSARPARERTTVRSDDQLFDRVLRRSLDDLELLRSEHDGHAYFAAGLPWYATLFGRDSLIAAMQALPFEPAMAADTLRLLAELIGRERVDARDEEPGKILHERRVGEPATLGETPFARYYGTADATPLWLCLLCDYTDWTGTLDLFRELRSQVDAALEWMERHGDLDGDGLVEYRRRAPGGLVNQGWKDSPGGVPYADGHPLEPPVALVEVQGYVARALRGVARLAERCGGSARAAELRARADRSEAALERLWLAEAGSYAIGLDADKRPGSALTSNQGHLLWAGVVSEERAARVRDVLMGDAMFSGWGVRTLAEGHPGYNPLGYHTGSVWPHDNALIAAGLRRYGFDESFGRVFEALLEAASRFAGYRLPELYAGYGRTPGVSPVPYPVACQPQAWAAGAIPYLLATGLGLRPDALQHRLRIVSPLLPPWLGTVELHGLRVGGASVDLRFARSGGEVVLADARVEGELELVVEAAGAARIA